MSSGPGLNVKVKSELSNIFCTYLFLSLYFYFFIEIFVYMYSISFDHFPFLTPLIFYLNIP